MGRIYTLNITHDKCELCSSLVWFPEENMALIQRGIRVNFSGALYT